MTGEQLALRARIFDSFAQTGEPPDLPASADLRALAEQHVVVLDDDARIVAAHPFAAAYDGATRVEGRAPGAARRGVWFGSCAWDGLGIAAALRLDDATVESGGVSVDEAALFHVAVPARHWWDDIAFT